MSILGRMHNIVKSKANALKNNHENNNCDIKLQQLINETQSKLNSIKIELNTLLRKEQEHTDELLKIDNEISKFTKYKNTAKTNNDDAKYKQFSSYLDQLELKKQSLVKDHTIQQKKSLELKAKNESLLNELEETLNNLNDLDSTLNLTLVKEQLNQINYDAFYKINSLSDNINKRFSTAEALEELNSEFSSNTSLSLDNEFAKLENDSSI